MTYGAWAELHAFMMSDNREQSARGEGSAQLSDHSFFVVGLESRGPGYTIERFRVETLLGRQPSAELLQAAVEADGSRGAYFGARWEGPQTLILYTD